MRKIKFIQILTFVVLFLIAMSLAVLTTTLVLGNLVGDFRGIVLSLSGILLLYLYAIAVYRLLLHVSPLPEGVIGMDSRDEFATYHVYLLFYLVLFYPVMRSGAVPVPLMRLVYCALGAKLGTNTYSSGIILDPPFVEIGGKLHCRPVCTPGATRHRRDRFGPLAFESAIT